MLPDFPFSLEYIVIKQLMPSVKTNINKQLMPSVKTNINNMYVYIASYVIVLALIIITMLKYFKKWSGFSFHTIGCINITLH